MRDANRIPEVLNELEKLWIKYPDWRFGQLICNLQKLNCGTRMDEVEE